MISISENRQEDNNSSMAYEVVHNKGYILYTP